MPSSLSSDQVTTMTTYSDGMGTYSLTVDGEARTYMVYVPPGLTTYTAIYFFLHGHGGFANQACTTQFNVELGSLALGYIAVCPQASQDLQGRRTWHAFPGGSYYGPAYRFDYAEFAAHSDKDVDFIDTLIDTINASKPVDKVFLAGYSRGASMAYYYHCVRAHRLDGMVAIANQWFDPYVGWGYFATWDQHTNEMEGVAGPTPDQATMCQPSKPIPVWMATGAQDGFYRGNQRASWDVYAKRVMGCTGEPFTAWSSPLSTLQNGQAFGAYSTADARARSEHATVSTSSLATLSAAMELGQLCTHGRTARVVVLQRKHGGHRTLHSHRRLRIHHRGRLQGLLCYRRHRTLRRRHIHRSHPLMG